MKKILWFSDIGRSTGFSRVSENLLSRLQNYFQITCLAPPKHLLKIPSNLKDVSFEHVGESFDLGSGEHYDPRSLLGVEARPALMKRLQYAALQLVNLAFTIQPDFLVILIGNSEISFFLDTIHQIRRHFKPSLKVIAYAPIDHGLNEQERRMVAHLKKADIIYTMNDQARESIEKLLDLNPSTIKTVPHGVNCETFFPNDIVDSRRILKGKGILPPYVEDSATIFLNNNRAGPRKRLVVTVDSFLLLWRKMRHREKLYLWINSNFSVSQTDLAYIGAKMKKYSTENPIILTFANHSQEDLNLIYNSCQIGVNTSWGEAWGLCAFEHAACGRPQILPDYLGCRYFKDVFRLLKVSEQVTLTDSGDAVTVGMVDKIQVSAMMEWHLRNKSESIAQGLKALELCRSLTWDHAANLFRESLTESPCQA